MASRNIRHHNNKGTRRIKRGKTRVQIIAIAKRLGVPVANGKAVR